MEYSEAEAPLSVAVILTLDCTMSIIDADVDDVVNVTTAGNIVDLLSLLTPVNINADCVAAPEPDIIALSKVNVVDVIGITYDPLLPTHSFALLAVDIFIKNSPDAVLAQNTFAAVGLAVIIGLLDVTYCTGFDAGTCAELDTVPDGSWAELLTIPTGNNVVTCTDPDTTPPPNAAVGILPVFKYCPDNLSGIHVSKKVFYIHIMPSR